MVQIGSGCQDSLGHWIAVGNDPAAIVRVLTSEVR